VNRIKRLQKQLEEVRSEILDLDRFRDTPSLRKFKRILQGELSTIKEMVRKISESQESTDKRRQQRRDTANKNRSSKNKRSWNYVKSIQRNYFADKPIKEIRTALKNHRKGLETDIPDVVWRNPSP